MNAIETARFSRHRGPGRKVAFVVLRLCCLGAVLWLVAGCAARPLEIGREPELTPVGSGLMRPVKPEIQDRQSLLVPARVAGPESGGSLWRESGADLFKDPRARRTGDILTVTISMKDKAALDNSSNRTRTASDGFGLDFSEAMNWTAFSSAATAKANSSLNTNKSQDGKGAIARSESIDLRIAAVVTDVLPNGNLLIQGSQELRVNYELRVLTFTGVVNIADIKADNTIPHDRIAEARMSYGGRGRIMEVQQPGWGQQVIDVLAPF